LTCGGKSLVLSVSGKKEIARAMSAKPFVLDDNSSGNYGFYLNEEGVFESVYPSKPAKMLVNKETVKAVFGEVIPCGFNLEDGVELNLVGEVAFARILVDSLVVPGSEFAKYLDDEVPDMYSVGFSGLKGIEKKYGKDSKEVKCAVGLVDEAMKKVVEGMKGVYGEGKVLVEGVFVDLGGGVEGNVNGVKSAVAGIEAVEMKDQIGELYPNVYLSGKISAERKEKLCLSLTTSLSGLSLQVEEMPEPLFAEMKNSYQLVEKARRDDSNSTIMTDMEVFQTVLWSSIGLGIAAVAGSYIMLTIDPSTDALLYTHDINHPNPKAQAF